MAISQYAQRAVLALGDSEEKLVSYRLEGDQIIVLIDRGIGGITKHYLPIADLPPLPKPEPPKPPEPEPEPKPEPEPEPELEPKVAVKKRSTKQQL